MNYDYDYFCDNMTVGSKIEYGSNHFRESHGMAQSHTITGLNYSIYLPLYSWVAGNKSGQWKAPGGEAFLFLELFGSFCFKTKMNREKQYFHHSDQRANGYDIRYKFIGKERDAETGFDYFGARYYASDLSIWLSVDPLSDKYPSMSAFMYTAGNPVMLVDPDGREIVDPKNGRKVTRVNGKWKTIRRVKKNGEKVYGKVSKRFVKSSQPILDDFLSTKTGTEIYNDYQNSPTKVVFDLHDSYNLDCSAQKKTKQSARIFVHL